MSRSEKQREYIAQLKKVKESKGYGYQRIVDAAEAAGEYVSLSSVRRVFADGYEELNFRDETLRAIGRALLETTEPTLQPITVDSGQRQEYYEQIEALKAAVEYKAATIDQLSSENTRLTAEIDHLRMIVDLRQKIIDQLRTLLAKREQQLDDKDADARSLIEDVRRKDRKIAELMDKIEELRNS